MPDYGTTTPTAGWYTDPANATLERWWGGVEWTHDTRPIPVAAAPAAPVAAGIPGGGVNPFATAQPATNSWTATAPVAATTAQAPGIGNYYEDTKVAGPPKVSPGWYDQGRMTQAQPPTNGAATRALVFGIVSWLFNPLLIFSIVGLRSAKRGLENAQMFEYERREPVGRTAAKVGRGLSVVSLVFGSLYFLAVGISVYLFTTYHDFVLENLWASQAASQGLPGSTLDCPAEGSYANGSSFVCEVQLADGRSGQLRFTINDFYAGDVSVEPVD